MALPSFRKRRSANAAGADGSAKDGALTDADAANIKNLTKTRRNIALVSSFCYLLAFIFLVLVRELLVEYPR